ncbi:MAG: HD domain-containing protein [Desulfovibrio sp.]|nr:HD domain-containing protein [Desulfovibrio sp.]
MRQHQFQFESLGAAIGHLRHIRETLDATPHKDALLNIFTSGISVQEVETLLAELDKQLPGVKRVGVAGYKFYGDAGKPLVALNVLASSCTEFHILRLPCEPGGERLAAARFLDALDGMRHAKAIALFPVNPGLDVTDFLHAISERYEEIPVFGTVARPSDAQNDSFAIGQTLLSCGFVAAVYVGEALQVYMDYILGWNPIGREMSITLGERPTLGESVVSRIDGRPAVDIYKKYLGIEWDGDTIENVWMFPLMIKRNTVNICYIPVASKDGNLYFSGTIYDNEKIRFSYCTREEILDASFNGSERMTIFSPDAVFLVLCGNRVGFLQDEAHLEWDYYRNNHQELAYCHGYGEISFQNRKGGVLNSAFVAVGMREGSDSPKQTARYSIIPQKKFTPTGKIPLSYLVSHFFHEMTNELTHFQKHLESEVERKTQENVSLSLHVVQALAQAIDAKDTYTNGHSSRVAKYSVEIARRAGYTKTQLNEMYMMSLLHDVGKIGVPDEIINKPAKLTDAEYAIIKKHPAVGAEILHGIKEMPKLVTGARWHHERYDGKGYPDGLKGKNIPEEARIIAVADAYDAMTSNRSYRKELSQAVVRGEVEKGKGTQFDPNFADIMISMIDEDTEYTMKE